MTEFKDISSFNAKKIIEENINNKHFEIIDVRTKQEFDEGHIKNSKLIDIYKEDFTQKIQELDKNKKFLVYCRTGSRSKYACKFMNNLGFEHLLNLQDGYLDWTLRHLD